jgi:hypothetical protein
MSTIVSDTEAVIGEVIPVPPTTTTSRFSWSAAIAGAIAATAVTFLILSLGSGIGLSVASPYRMSPSATTLTLGGALWLLIAQTFGFACGGYLAARMRAAFPDDVGDEVRFRDAAQGFLVWAIGVVITAAFVALAGLYAAGAAANFSAGTAAGLTATSSESQTSARASTTDAVDYFVDVLFRPPPATAGSAPAAANREPLNPQMRAEVTRIVARGVAQGQLSDGDRAYLAQVVAQRTGMSQDEAERRVTDVENQTRDAIKQTADKAAKAGAFLSFWVFMALLFGATAAILAGILGGESRQSDGAWSPAIQPR